MFPSNLVFFQYSSPFNKYDFLCIQEVLSGLYHSASNKWDILILHTVILKIYANNCMDQLKIEFHKNKKSARVCTTILIYNLLFTFYK